MKSCFAVVLLSLTLVVGVAAQEPTPVNPPPNVPPPAGVPAPASGQTVAPNYVIDIHRFSSAPVLDGDIGDPVWQEGNFLTDFVQLEPDTGKPSTQRTEVWMGYDSRNLYVAIRCYDEHPDKLLTSSMRIDADLTIDDSVTVVLDTFLDHRNGFLFSVNPIGAKTDALVRNEGEEINYDWNGLWEAATRRDAKGWTVEMAIPFKTLRFPHTDPQTWGFNIRRLNPRRQESSYWKPLQRHPGSFAGYEISEFGEIRGLSGLGRSGHYQFTPFAIARDERDFHAVTKDTANAGGDLKVNITSDLTADLTVRTDFAEVEADQQQFNLERFKLFYPEQRQFFLEGANLFYFGDRPEPFDVPEKFYFFFSRQIGLAQDGRVVIPVLGGAKVTGQAGSTSVGFLNMTTQSTSYFDAGGSRIDEPQTNFTVLRVKQQVFDSSTIGIIGLNRDPEGPHYNRGGGLDWDFAFNKKWYTAGYVAKTETPGLDGRDTAYSADVVYRGENLRARYRHTDIGDNFNPEMGFITRTGIVKDAADILATFVWPDNPLHFHKYTLVYDLNHISDQKGNAQTQLTTYEFGTTTVTSGGVAFLYYDDLEDLATPLQVAKNATIPAGHYRFRSFFTGLGSGYAHRFGFTLWYHEGGYYGGDRLRTLLSIAYRPFDGLVINPVYDRVRVNAPWGNFVDQIAQTSVDYSISPRLLVRTTLQWREGDNYRANFMIDWTYRPGSDIFLVYNDIQDLNDLRRNSGFSPLSPGKTIIAKVTRRFDF